MFLKIDPSSGVPIYMQIMEQIKYSIAIKALKPGDKIPSIRNLSMDLKVNPNTVSKAFSELEHAKVIETRRGMGAYVSDNNIEMSEEAKMEIVTKLAERLAVEAVQLDIKKEDVSRVVEKALDRFFDQNREGEEA